MNQVEVKRRQIEILSYIIGLINIFIFGKILGNNGITYLIVALEGFSVIWTISAGSLADTLGKILRKRIGKGQYKNAMYIRKRVMIIQGSLGVVFSIVFAACANVLAQDVFKVPHSTFIMAILSPVIFLKTISSVLIGYFRGEGSELPAVVAAPLRQLALMGFGILFVNMLGSYGNKVSNLLGDTSYTAMYGGVGIAIAILLTEILVTLFLSLITIGNRKTFQKRDSEGMKQTDSLLDTVRVLYGSMWMALLLKVFEILPIWIGTIFYRKSVSDVETFCEHFGLLSGKFMVVCGIPVLLICALLLSVSSKTTASYRKEDYRGAKFIFQSGLHIAIVHGLFFTVFTSIMAEQVAGMVCGENSVEVVTELLRYGSPVMLLLVLFYYFSRLLLTTGKKYHLLGCVGIVNILYIIMVTVLLNNGKIGVQSLIYAAIAAFAVGCVITGFLCCKMLHTGIEWLQAIAIPIGAACVAGLLSMFLGKIFTPHLGNLVTVFVCLILSFIIYWVLLLLLRSFKEQELKHIPGGGIIRAAGQTLRVFYMD